MKVVAYVFVGVVDGSGRPYQNFIWEDLKGKPALLYIIDIIGNKGYLLCQPSRK